MFVCFLKIELKEDLEASEVGHRIHNQLISINDDYRDLQDMTNIRPLKVTVLPKGSFLNFYEKKRQAGADLAHLKPPHMNVSDAIIKELTPKSRLVEKK